MSPCHPLSPRVAIRFAHAAVQAVADELGVDVLHIKGPATDGSLLWRMTRSAATGEAYAVQADRQSSDADVLVRPDQVRRLVVGMKLHGWRLDVDFSDGSAFEHAATMGRDTLAPVDLHRRFPGFSSDPSHVFEVLWQGRESRDIAGRPCWVPGLDAQRLVLILNAVRGGPARQAEIDRLWGDANDSQREAVQRLAEATSAQVALAAATGRLSDYSGSREYELWRLLSTGDASPVALWWARVRAQPTLRQAIREGFRRLVPNPHRVAFRLGRPLTGHEIARLWFTRLKRGAQALAETTRSRRG